MKRLLTLLAVVALLTPATLLFAQEAPPQPAVQAAQEAAAEAVQEAAVVEVTQVIVRNTTYEKATLERSFKLVADQLSKHLKKATFKVDGSILYVGVQYDVLAKDATLAKIDFSSDCPDNSQFHVQPSVLAALGTNEIKEVLIAWTRYRHDAMAADVRVVNVADRTRYVNFDVQLNIRKVALR